MWQFWLIAAGIFFIVEMATVGFFVFWLGIGALIAMICSFFIPNVYIQAFIFVVSSSLLILFTKPFITKFVSKGRTVPTNAFSIIGKHGIVTKEINPLLGTGQIKISGESWSARSDNEDVIPENCDVEVVRIDGVKAVVKVSVLEKQTTTVSS